MHIRARGSSLATTSGIRLRSGESEMMSDESSKALRWIYRVKAVVPSRLWSAATSPYWWWYNRARHQAAAVISTRLRRDQQTTRQSKDRHRGERCFILGNGPSLQKTDLSLLRGERTFGLNRIYLLFPDLGFSTTYLVVVNTLVIEQCAREMKDLAIPKYVTWRGRRWLSEDPGTIFLDTDYTPPATFSPDASRRIYEGSTVTYVALQLAFHMGFEEVILVGVDHRFQSQGAPNVTVTSQGPDPNHFSANYFGPGFRWQLPDLEASERAYRLARDAYQAAGRRVLDATVDGALTVFPKVDYHRLFK
jgi:hypothetical protein